MEPLDVRTKAVIRLDALAHNIACIRSRLDDSTKLIAVLKGDGYGHGIAGIYPTLKKCGISCFAVAVWEEGVMLRNLGCTDPVMLLGDTCDGQLDKILQYDLTPTIFCFDTARKLNALAQAAGKVVPISIKIDTGMHRIGFPADPSAIPEIQKIHGLSNLTIAGAFSHFAKADEPDGISAGVQFRKFTDMMQKLEDAGIHIPLKHMSNSPAILLRPEVQLDAVRAGDILFGLCPVDANIWEKSGFRQVLHWYTSVALVKEVPVGSEVGYGGTFIARRPTKIATIPIGFADGYSRRLSNLGMVKINGKTAPVVGRICMDQFTVDVTDLPEVHRGDTVALLDDELSILWMADLLDVNVDEIVCNISKRVPRVYE